MEQLIEKRPLVKIEEISPDHLPELQGWIKRQQEVVTDNPYLEINDHKSYEEAKRRRTALLQARTTLEKQDKAIASKIRAFRNKVIGFRQELIAISKPHEDKQQQEVSRWEAKKKREKEQRRRLEQERIEKIRVEIQSIYTYWNGEIEQLSFNRITDFSMRQTLEAMDVSTFEEFAPEFTEKKQILKRSLIRKITQLREQETRRMAYESLKREREELERQKRRADEKARKAQEELAAEREKIRAERERIEQAEKARLKAEQQAEYARAEAQRKAKAEQAQKKRVEEQRKRLEALKPDKEKISAFITSLYFDAEKPQVKDSELKSWLEQVISEVAAMKMHLKNQLSNLK